MPAHRSCAVVGIIPADAGSTNLRRYPYCHDVDHPRGCGEHDFITPHSLRRTGSSPRMRGAQNQTLL